jgi:hypothetical protein
VGLGDGGSFCGDSHFVFCCVIKEEVYAGVYVMNVQMQEKRYRKEQRGRGMKDAIEEEREGGRERDGRKGGVGEKLKRGGMMNK